MFEDLIAYHGAPALAGIKPANILSCVKSHIPNVHEEIEKLNASLNRRDIYIEALCERKTRILIMVYRKSVLETHLQKPEMAAFLSTFGYPQTGSVAEYISALRSRLLARDFPHEIGVFLGYPLHDIHGFIHHRDNGCLLTGEWKVYKDAEGAKKLFSRYRACREAIVKRLHRGYTLTQIFCAA